MKMRYYHKKKAVKTAIKSIGIESYMLQKVVLNSKID